MFVQYNCTNIPLNEVSTIYIRADEINALFPARVLFAEFEGGAVWEAEKKGRYYLIVDESAMADFLLTGEDDDLLDQLTQVYEFNSPADRDQYAEKRGWKPAGERQ